MLTEKISTQATLPKQVECIVIGAGIIGLAMARLLAKSGYEVLVLEKNADIGEETSFRNSAVLHAGIYYPANSLKAKLCKQGQVQLYDYCKNNAIPHQKIGKLIVATHVEQLEKLNQLAEQAKKNGVNTLVTLEADEISRLEPEVKAIRGLYSSETGIVHGKSLLLSLKRDAEQSGAKIVCHASFLSGKIEQGSIKVTTSQGMVTSRYLINAAGLWATQVARNLQGMPAETIPTTYYAKGNYFKLNTPSPFKHLIYPLPESAGLGIHSTLDLQGNVRFGPDVEWINELDYQVSLSRQEIFCKEIRKYYPGLKSNALLPEFVGIRPKISSPDKQPQDFLIQDTSQHGIKNIIHLYGMESPGLTASFAIADHVKQLMH